MSDLLTADEHDAVEALGAAWDAVVKVINAGGNPDTYDSHELVGHVHALQNAVLANAAARAYPNTYRSLGGSLRMVGQGSPAGVSHDWAKARRRPRLRACVEAWPEAEEGEYNPACCRFPKSCSADVYPEGIDPDMLVPVP